mmetsp:Transcript_79550/g.125473  ORF Transcript_79550/g.125473 Transcript_79550/m.125473 type:complete len:201 (-) Transcript_79550:1651-2253(-)
MTPAPATSTKEWHPTITIKASGHASVIADRPRPSTFIVRLDATITRLVRLREKSLSNPGTFTFTLSSCSRPSTSAILLFSSGFLTTPSIFTLSPFLKDSSFCCVVGRDACQFSIPMGTNWSVVSVPVLSNTQTFTLPARGTRKGSVQKTPRFISPINAVFTANAICIGSCFGTVEVMIMTHLMSNSWVVRSPFSSPFFNT